MNENKLNKAREFCHEVGKLAKKYGLPVFIVTDGASLTSNNGNPCIRFHREKQIEWENNNGFNPDEDWGSSFESANSKIQPIVITKMLDSHKDGVVVLMDNAVEYHMSISKAFSKYIQTEDPEYHNSNLNHVLDKDNMFYVAVSGNEVIGYIEYKDRGSHVAIRDFYVNPNSRGNGIGLRLLNQVKMYSKNKEIKLTCLKENKIACKFYLSNGFKINNEIIDDETGISIISMSYNSKESINIRQANNNDRTTIRNMTMDLDEYYCETIPKFKETYDNEKRRQSYDFVDKLKIKDFYIMETSKKKAIGTIAKWNNNGEITLLNFYIKPEFRGKGYGKIMLDKVISEMEENYCVLSVYRDNKKSVKFYSDYGFKYLQTEETPEGKLMWLIYTKKI